MKRRGKLIMGIVIGVGIDLFTKYVFMGYDNFLMTPVFNPGVAWGVGVSPYISILIAIVVSLYIMYLFWKKQIMTISAILLIAGAVGNMYDRIVYHGVRDRIDIRIIPVFNVADMCITLGVVLYLRYIIYHNHDSVKK